MSDLSPLYPALIALASAISFIHAILRHTTSTYTFRFGKSEFDEFAFPFLYMLAIIVMAEAAMQIREGVLAVL